MRCITQVIAAGLLALGFSAPSAQASYTIDLIWAETGTSNLDVAPTIGIPGSSDSGTLCHAGANAPTQLGSCLLVRLTAAESFTAAIVTIGWEDFDLTLGRVAPRSYGQFAAPVGGLAPVPPKIAGTGDCLPECGSAYGSFGGSTPGAPAPAGTYVIGSLLFDPPFCCFPGPVFPFLRTSIDGVTDKKGVVRSVELNGATIFFAPEPATAGLLGVGLLALSALAPRRRP